MMRRFDRPEYTIGTSTTPGSSEELIQEADARRGEGGVDRLIGIAHAHPVAFLGEQAQDLFLQETGILRLVFEDVRPAGAQPIEQVLIGLQAQQREADQIVEVEAAAIAQAALVVIVDVEAHRADGPRAGEVRQSVRAARPA